ncbi:DUF3135 domain-containing protein [Ferrimonas sediminicola]|uniref:DUF3135 domain-containing protein n=1 Tax=Ferrimonas sediminicola TaxID=2569538 RepID=A0A4U1B836_9GAMM|nr:DUF3135 domain-containing protein [Ferrimonas sediminicola]TKB46786.1 DUF3135 domain-containing protein [Ferrimonas sediminicola]
MTELPTFDQMMHLAKTDPKQLERIREHAIDATINQAKACNRGALRALQHRIDLTRSRASNPYQSMVEISRMMHDKLDLLNIALNRPDELSRGRVLTLTGPHRRRAVNT